MTQINNIINKKENIGEGRERERESKREINIY